MKELQLTDAAKIYLHIMHIYTVAMLTDIATIVYNIGTRRTDSPLNTGIVDYAELFFVYCFPNQESA